MVPTDRIARVRQIRARLRSLNASAARTWWEFGSLFAEVKRDELWREDGADSFPAWLALVGWERETARKAMAVAANFTQEMTERYGTEKLAAAIGYLDATAQEERPGDLAALDVRFQGKDGQFQSVPFPKATVAQVKAAKRLVQAGARKPWVDAGKPYREQLTKLESALPPAPAGSRRARVQVAVGKDGRPALSFHDIPVDGLEAFIAALRAAFGPPAT